MTFEEQVMRAVPSVTRVEVVTFDYGNRTGVAVWDKKGSRRAFRLGPYIGASDVIAALQREWAA